MYQTRFAHVRYLRDSVTLCQQPERLDDFRELIKTDMIDLDRPACKECGYLLTASNAKMMERRFPTPSSVFIPRKSAINYPALAVALGVGAVFLLVMLFVGYFLGWW